MHIEIFKVKSFIRGTRWYFRIVAANHEIVAQSEAYNSLSACKHTARTLTLNLGPHMLIVGG